MQLCVPFPRLHALASSMHDPLQHSCACVRNALAAARVQTAALLEKRRAGQKRKLAQLTDALAERVADAEQRLKKLTSSAAKQRNISDVLKCLVPSADRE